MQDSKSGKVLAEPNLFSSKQENNPAEEVPYRQTVGANLESQTYSDADYAADVATRKSISGYTAIMAGGAVSWSSRQQKCVSGSTAKAEYVNASDAAQKAQWLRTFLKKLEVFEGSVTLFVDNRAAIHISKKTEHHKCSKHIDVRHHYIKHCIEESGLKVEYVPRELQVADWRRLSYETIRDFPNNDFKEGLSAYDCKEILDLAFPEQEFEHERPSVKHQKGPPTAVTEENIAQTENDLATLKKERSSLRLSLDSKKKVKEEERAKMAGSMLKFLQKENCNTTVDSSSASLSTSIKKDTESGNIETILHSTKTEEPIQIFQEELSPQERTDLDEAPEIESTSQFSSQMEANGVPSNDPGQWPGNITTHI
ncbi:hypothetical protein ILUMI_21483 [Ignelater luminosus]|uniref:Uncharacterized protein n=1 Tax=Ignelater luminosus TaxID=2038154 RepID=A0A8K0G3I7_IGNLU|nr:hypothetical protein ILUMI_21483 [Ignelater luminosus]